MTEPGTLDYRDEALAACASVLLREDALAPAAIEALMRRRDLAYSIDRHLDLCGTTLDPLTRALLAAARETICLD